MNLDNFTQVSTVNPRKSAADVTYNDKAKKFTVSEDLYNRLNLPEHGFALYVSTLEKRIAFALVSNEDASLMRGKRGFAKGRSFTATALVTAIKEFMPDTTEFSLQYMLTNDGIEYYEMVSAEEQTSSTYVDSSQDVIHDEPQSQEVESQSITDSEAPEFDIDDDIQEEKIEQSETF